MKCVYNPETGKITKEQEDRAFELVNLFGYSYASKEAYREQSRVVGADHE